MNIDIIRAWTDVEYRETLTAEQLASVPANPAGTANLSDAALSRVVGGTTTAEPQETTGIFHTLFGSRRSTVAASPAVAAVSDRSVRRR